MVSGADTVDTDNGSKWADTSSSSSSGHSSGHMDMEHDNSDNNHDNNSASVNGTSDNNVDNNTAATSNGNVEAVDHNMEVETPPAAPPRDNSIISNPARYNRLIEFGRSLHKFSEQLEQQKGRNSANVQILQEAFSLLAYSDPWNSPVGGQLDPAGREPVCAQLNSAILESKHLPGRPSLEVSVAHTSQLLKLMSHSDLGACAFANMETLMN